MTGSGAIKSCACGDESALKVRNLVKRYDGKNARGGKPALYGVSLTVPRGSIFGLLGPNGAGKSTLINIVSGLVRKSSGSVAVCGIDIDRKPRAARAALGIVPQELTLDPYFPARDAIELQAGLFGIPRSRRRTDELLDALGLTEHADSPARSLSGGMRRRLMVAKALVHNPAVLILDEPTAGVDVELRRQLWDYVRDLNRAGTTVLLTTHYLHEAESLCDRIAVLMHGRIIVDDTPEVLLRQVQVKQLKIEFVSPLSAVPEELRRFDPVLVDPHHLVFRYPHGSDMLERLLPAIHTSGLRVRDVTTERADLESAFLQILRRTI